MTDNEKIARWAGYECLAGIWIDQQGLPKIKPTYSTDAEAIGLLNVLVGKNYECELTYAEKYWSLSIYCKTNREWIVENEWQPTIHEAIVAAVLQVIEKGGGG